MKKILLALICLLILLALFRVFFYERKIVKCGLYRCVVSINKITGNAEEKIIYRKMSNSNYSYNSKKTSKDVDEFCKNNCSNNENRLRCRVECKKSKKGE
jgi:hypothetical protein